MRPVERNASAERPAEQSVDRNAERLGFDVEAGVLDDRNRLRVEPAVRQPRHGVQRRAVAADLSWVHADYDVGEFADKTGKAAGAIAFVVLGPADETLVGHDLQERE